MSRMFMEEARSIEVFDECDILVVGGGAAGHSAAIAAARAGAKNIILLERYGYMGGDVTGGYVIMVPALTWRTGTVPVFSSGIGSGFQSVCSGLPRQFFT